MSDESLESLRALTAGRYTIERELGRGGMATVYLAHDLKHDRPVALKFLHPELAASVGAERFLREIRVAARIQHPNVVAVFDSGGDHARLWYTMPYVAGESLRERLTREGQLPLAVAASITRQVASALVAAHADGVVHRDIKPENILLRGDHALVADFGIARAAASGALTSGNVSLGTPTYMSPEQVSGDEVDGRSDLFSLGCVLYEMLAGQPPFVGPTLQATLARRLLEPAASVRSLRPEVPPWLEAVLERTLARAPDQRYDTAVEVVAAVDGGAAAGQSLGSLVARIKRPGARRKTLAVAGLALLGLAVVVSMPGLRPAPRITIGDENSLAVLGFQNNSPDSSDAYLASGLTEEISSRLGEVARLRVKGSQAVARLPAGLAGDYPALGNVLQVRYLVEGSVRRAGGRVKITVQLVTTGDGFRIWNQDYDGAASDLISLQEEIAGDVARQIAGELLPQERAALAVRGTDDPLAYEHFLRGNFQLAQRNAQAMARAISQFDSALMVDPRFTQTRARLAYGYGQFLDWDWSLPGVSRDTVLARGLAASKQALAEDSLASEAWLARGYLLTFADPLEFAGAEAALTRAIALDATNAEAHHQFGWVLHQLGHDSLALREYHRALALEPERPSTLRSLSLVPLLAGRYQEAERWLDSTLQVDPGFYSAYGLRGLARLRRGDLAGARADGEMSLRLRPSDTVRGEFVLALADAASGDRAGARQRIDRLLGTVGPGPVSLWEAWYLAIAMAGSGDRAGAMALVDRVQDRGVVWRFAFGAKVLDSLRLPTQR